MLSWRGIALLILLDQLLKQTLISHLPYLIVVNKGIAFGFFNQPPQLLGLIALLVLIAVVFVYKRGQLSKIAGGKTSIGLSFLMAGAASNIIDRLARGVVIDYINLAFVLKKLKIALTWPVFNLADLAIFIGIIILILPAMLGKNAY